MLTFYSIKPRVRFAKSRRLSFLLSIERFSFLPVKPDGERVHFLALTTRCQSSCRFPFRANDKFMRLTDPSANSNSDTDTDTDAAGGDIHPKGLTKVRALYMSKMFVGATVIFP